MGEIADMILEGILDEQTGEYLGKAVGYPRTKVKGCYNTIPIKNKNVGGRHLIGKKVFTERYGNCKIIGLTGKRGKRRYTLVCKNGNVYKVKYKSLIFK